MANYERIVDLIEQGDDGAVSASGERCFFVSRDRHAQLAGQRVEEFSKKASFRDDVAVREAGEEAASVEPSE